MQEAQFSISTRSIFTQTSHFFDVNSGQKGPLLVMCFGPVALFLFRFPFGPPHAPQAGPQNTSQICVFLLQVASLDDFSDVSDIILMKSCRIRHRSDDILMYPILFWLHFALSDQVFHDCF